MQGAYSMGRDLVEWIKLRIQQHRYQTPLPPDRSIFE